MSVSRNIFKSVQFQRQQKNYSEHCCVPLCPASGRFNGALSFHSFPPQTELRSQWIHNIRRDNLTITPHTKICSRHFIAEHLVEPKSSGGRRRLAKGAVPLLFEWNSYSTQNSRFSQISVCESRETAAEPLMEEEELIYTVEEDLEKDERKSDDQESESEDSDCSNDSGDSFVEAEDPLLDHACSDEDSHEERESCAAKRQSTTSQPEATSSCSLLKRSCPTLLPHSETQPSEQARTAKKHRREFASEGDEKDVWHDISEEDQQPDLPQFQPTRPPGPQVTSTLSYSPLEIFQMFMSASAFGTVVKNTNAYANQRAQVRKHFVWSPLTVDEFYTYVGIVILMGLMPLKDFNDYWSKKTMYNLSFPRSVMSRNRFLEITWNLHFCDPEKDKENKCKKGTAQYDPLFKIKPFYTIFLSACQACFQPNRELWVGQWIVASNVQLGFGRYMRDKNRKLGYRLFVLADSTTGYSWHIFVYKGEHGLRSEKGLSYDSVTELVKHPLLGKGYKLYLDSFHTSPVLLSDLFATGVVACGTVSTNRQDFHHLTCPEMPKDAPRGAIRWKRHGELLFVSWMDTKEVTMCSTFHKAYDGDKVKRRVKDQQGAWRVKQIPIPCAVKDYSRNMAGMDLSDALDGYNNLLHKIKKWYRTCFFHFIDIAIMNSFILHKHLALAHNQDAMTHKQFREVLVSDLTKRPARSAPHPQPSEDDVCYPAFFTEDPTLGRRVCEVCKLHGKKMKTPAYCMKCRVPLCLMPKRNCFLYWHQEGLQNRE